MIDTVELLATTDLRAVLIAEIGEPTRAGNWHCPFHPDKTPSFGIVKDKPHLWHCFSCGKTGDAIALLRELRGLSFVETCEHLADGMPPAMDKPRRRQCAPALRHTEQPMPTWAARAATFAEQAELLLWKPEGRRGLDYLRGRGLDNDTIRAARLGWIPADLCEPATAWGLNGEDLWLPSGILIPWRNAEGVFRLNIRRLSGSPKYIGPRGWKTGLYQPSAKGPLPVVLVEGEFDALKILQAAGDLIQPMATGSTTGAQRIDCVYALAAADDILLGFDADRAGMDATAWWAEYLPHARRIAWPGKDAGELSIDALRACIRNALGLPPEPKPKQWPPMPPGLSDEEAERLAIMTVEGGATDAEALDYIMEQRKESRRVQ